MASIDCVIIGAGWAGLSAAAVLKASGREVLVLDKARGPGGRSSTRRQGGFRLDHGAQYFTARSDAFIQQVQGWRDLGLVQVWDPAIEVFGDRPDHAGQPPAERLVGVPGMNAVLGYQAKSQHCRFGWRLENMRFDGQWQLLSSAGEQIQARHLLLTAPAPQALELLGRHHPLAERLAAVRMAPCWTLMLGFDRKLEQSPDAAFVNQGPISWLARNGTKPGRREESWVVQASGPWSCEHLEDSADDVADKLLAAFHALVPAARERRPSLKTAHRWRYAQAENPLDCQFFGHPEQNLAVAGDWCAGNRIEGAWTSGRAAAIWLSERSV
ncbi:MAG: FAD-dependent oxidoreductase [Wenzhouxiangellaceae bacterium]|nr:MAG: FAD-dependent oxidoreductase [Wenzhouxiangellaceae bacterium]